MYKTSLISDVNCLRKNEVYVIVLRKGTEIWTLYRTKI